jgi:hypothetical protein
MSTNRGKALHREFPSLLLPLWPFAEPVPGGRNGRDVLGTPGVAWEIKTAGLDNLRPDQWIGQATRNAMDDMPIAAWFPQKVGIGSPDRIVCMTPFPWQLRLLAMAGYGGTAR